MENETQHQHPHTYIHTYIHTYRMSGGPGSKEGVGPAWQLHRLKRDLVLVVCVTRGRRMWEWTDVVAAQLESFSERDPIN
jgi:hypothetical protein